MPHALLFTGIEGVGKQKAARVFAKACNCMAENFPADGDTDTVGGQPVATLPCGACRSCRKIDAGTHPDIFHIQPSGRQIVIEQIRSLLDNLAMKPYEAKVRVVIVRQAETMNPSAANAFLKMLEEPPARTVLILVAPHPTNLLPTIASRCQHIRFNPISKQSLAQHLVSQKAVAPERAEVLAAMARGSLSRALEMEGADWLRQRDWLIKASGLDQPGKLASLPIAKLLAVAEALAKNRKELSRRLDVMLFWIRDLIVYPFDASRLINTDQQDTIARAAGQLPLPVLINGFQAVAGVQKKLQSNLNVRLTLEDMMFKLAGLYSPVE